MADHSLREMLRSHFTKELMSSKEFPKELKIRYEPKKRMSENGWLQENVMHAVSHTVTDETRMLAMTLDVDDSGAHVGHGDDDAYDYDG